ncbi:transcriptional Coactivator p15-domain-containing protein [Coprinopsis sp. MPI-PUGE-AT-0042]|nr:transcriptional Coactivator p15-domain-containing protein [Coprinopsis sp. MPI-PUGE-AT-0042]
MGKRKVEESEQESASEAEAESSASETVVTKKKAPAKSKGIKKPTLPKSDSGSGEEHVSKKTKRDSGSKGKAGPSSEGSTVKKNKDGDGYIDLGKKKHATVRVFKGMPLIDIREFYGDGNDLKPGKKGISLTIEQWKTLRNEADTIDELIQKVTKK